MTPRGEERVVRKRAAFEGAGRYGYALGAVAFNQASASSMPLKT